MVRAQAHSLEAIFAAFVILSGLVFALQATAVTPLSASTSSQYIENQHRATAEGILTTAGDTGALRVAVLNWNDTTDAFYDADTDYYSHNPPDNRFGDMLEQAFVRQGIVVNVDVSFETDNERRRSRRLVYNGNPSDNAASATTSVVLFDSDVLYDGGENRTETTISSSTFYAPDVATSDVYNVLTVRVVVWRQ